MIYNDKSGYIDLGKTGSSYIEDVLKNVSTGIGRNFRHVGLKQREEGFFYYTTIRNPWKYYVSHLEYSKKTSGQILKHVTGQNYRETSIDQYVDIICVKRHSLPEINHKNKLGRAWKNMPDDMGMLTCQYIVWTDEEFLCKPRSEQEIVDWFNAYYFKPNEKFFGINTDNMYEDLTYMFTKWGHHFSLKDNWIEELDNFSKPKPIKHKVNIHDHKKHYEGHEKTIDIIRHQERLLIDHYGFTI